MTQEEITSDLSEAVVQEPTVISEPEINQPVDQESSEEPVLKTFTQEELDNAISKRLARERRKWDRENKENPVISETTVNDKLSIDDFETAEEYAQALAEQKAEHLVYIKEHQRIQKIVMDSYLDREEKARDKYEDFDQVVFNNNLKISEIMASSIRDSEIGPEIAYYLGINPKEADRIYSLSPISQAKEIGKLEIKLENGGNVKKITNTPTPISPISSNGSNSPSIYDTTDPRSIKTMSTTEWINAERQRQLKKKKGI